MKKVLLYILLTMVFSLFAQNQELLEEDIEAQKDMVAFMQVAVQFRYGDSLKVGDRVEYKRAGSKDDESIFILEVTEKTDRGVWIVEKFDGNEVHVHVDLKNDILLDIWGYDEYGNRQEPELITTDEARERISYMLHDIPHYSDESRFDWNLKRERLNIEFSGKTLSTIKIVPEYVGEGIGRKDKLAIEKSNEMVYSNDVPILIPLELSLDLIDKFNYLPQNRGGFVKNLSLELKSFRKVTK